MTIDANRANSFASMMRVLPVAVLALGACGPVPGEGTYPSEAGAQRGPLAFDVRLTFTPRAADRLGAANERVTVSGMYWGMAKPGMPGEAAAQISLGADEVDVPPANATVLIPGTGLQERAVSGVDGGPQVLVNVYSARRSHPDNLLNCGLYEGSITMAQQKPVEIQCDLIDGPDGEPL